MVVILEPGFETVTNWTYSENDPDGHFTGGQSTTWKTEGTYSYLLKFDGLDFYYAGRYCQIKQTINIPTTFGFYIDIHSAWDAYGMKIQILVDTTVVWEQTITQTDWINEHINLVAFSGNHDLIFRIWTPSDAYYGAGADVYFDNIRETTTLLNTYVNSSTGNDANAGDSCVAGHPKLTFAAAYALLASGGTIHVCNTGADFSAETVTLNKSFSIDLNGASGYFYMPKAS